MNPSFRLESTHPSLRHRIKFVALKLTLILTFSNPLYAVDDFKHPSREGFVENASAAELGHFPRKNPVVLPELDAYLNGIIETEESGGRLHCPSEPSSVVKTFASCDAFYALKSEGCFGITTADIRREYNYESLCNLTSVLRSGARFSTSYFLLESEDWWKSLPGEIVPMPGGIYNDESWASAEAARESLVTGKLLGDIDFIEVRTAPGVMEAIIGIEVDSCGSIYDRFEISAITLADFDGDGIAELLLEGYRAYHSDSCLLGTGSGVGSRFRTIVRKLNEGAPVLIYKAL